MRGCFLRSRRARKDGQTQRPLEPDARLAGGGQQAWRPCKRPGRVLEAGGTEVAVLLFSSASFTHMARRMAARGSGSG